MLSTRDAVLHDSEEVLPSFASNHTISPIFKAGSIYLVGLNIGGGARFPMHHIPTCSSIRTDLSQARIVIGVPKVQGKRSGGMRDVHLFVRLGICMFGYLYLR